MEVAAILLSILDVNEQATHICFSLSDVQDWLQKKGFRDYDISTVRNVLQNLWHLKPTDNSYGYLQYK